jgi:hypothetical protein
MSARTGFAWALSGTLLFACSSATERSLGSDPGGAAGMAGTGASGAGGSGVGGGIDVDAATGGASGAPPECQNVDVVFVVDSSGSMSDNQQSLINSFPGFVDAIKGKLAYADSYHVGVVTSDAYAYNQPGCTEIGDLVTQTGGVESSNAVCGPFANGKRYLDEKEPDLAGKFACIAKVGPTGSDDERMARGLLNAINPANNAPGACNDGFSRLDSLLVVVMITDEDDVPDVCGNEPFSPCGCQTCGSGGDSSAWHDELVGYKAGIEQNIVVLSLLGLSGNNSCGAVPASKLMGFAHKFGDNGYTGDVCASSYDSFFAAVLPVIDQACQKYVPPPIQ